MSENTSNNLAPVVSPPEGGTEAPKRNKYEKKSNKKRIPKVIKIGVPLIIASAAVFGIVKFITGNTKNEEGDIVEATASTGTLSSYVTGWGSISPVSKAEYGKDIKGEVLEVAVQAGDLVKTGDLLFTIDPSEMKADLLKEKESLAALEKQLRDLGKNYENAVTALSEAREAYSNSSLTAPFTGMIISTAENMPKVGDSLSAGTTLGTLVDNSAMKLVLYFNRSYIGSVAAGQSVSVSIPDSMAQINGTISKILDLQKPIDGAICFGVEVKVSNPGGLSEGQNATGYVSTSTGNIMPSQAGTLEYWQKQDLIFKGVTAKIKSININQFATVTAGQALCSVDQKPASDAVSEAQYNVETYSRQMSDDYIQNDIKNSQKKITDLEQICTTSAFYSTIDGQVSAVMIKPGDKLTSSETAVLTVSDTSSLVINANIDEADISNVKVGMPVDITYDTSKGTGTGTGTITTVSFEAKAGSADSGSAYAYFPATISLQNDGTLLPGMSVNYSILAVTKDSCLMLPSQCVVNTENGPVVYVKNGQDFGYEKIEFEDSVVPEGYYAVSVEIGVADATNTEIVSGLEEGTVVYQGTMQSDQGYWG
ncbi:MAG: HlyD family efflux transporter periplasmic adaptor subunit [Clostridiaceae bacterium]|nr:HlyD family efflux transporter periplasmic adaptor subunit [Clostridiaceae bacterium]